MTPVIEWRCLCVGQTEAHRIWVLVAISFGFQWTWGRGEEHGWQINDKPGCCVRCWDIISTRVLRGAGYEKKKNEGRWCYGRMRVFSEEWHWYKNDSERFMEKLGEINWIKEHQTSWLKCRRQVNDARQYTIWRKIIVVNPWGYFQKGQQNLAVEMDRVLDKKRRRYLPRHCGRLMCVNQVSVSSNKLFFTIASKTWFLIVIAPFSCGLCSISSPAAATTCTASDTY